MLLSSENTGMSFTPEIAKTFRAQVHELFYILCIMDVCCCDVAILVFISLTDGAYLSLIENGQEAELNDIPKDRAQEMINSSTRMGEEYNRIYG